VVDPRTSLPGMPRADRAALRRALASYRGAPAGVRAFAAARSLIAPLGALTAEAAPLSGRMLSLGCGVGLIERYLTEINPRLKIEGIDLDPKKVDAITATQAQSPRFQLRTGDITALAEPAVYDAVLVCDVIHHLEPDAHARLAEAVARSLTPGGVCIIKDLDVQPRWKYEWNRLHDRVVAGPEPIFCRAPDEMAKLFIDAGVTAERIERIDRRFTPYAHYIVRLRNAQC
jgi:SAM-dependent methyltransferase